MIRLLFALTISSVLFFALILVPAIAAELERAVGDVTVTVVTDEAADLPDSALSERGEEITLRLRNDGERRARVRLNLYPVDVNGYDPTKAYFSRGASIPIAPGESNTTSLPMRDGLIPGKWRIEIKVDNTSGSLPVTIASTNPMARPLNSDDDSTLGPNIALSALGATIEASSQWDTDWHVSKLIDGINWTRNQRNSGRCNNCGWAAGKDDLTPEVTVILPGDAAAEIATVVFDTNRFWSSGRYKRDVTKWQPKNVAILVSKNGSPNSFTEVARARLNQDFMRQAIDLPPGTRARAVRIRILDTFNNEGGASFVELEIREAAGLDNSILSGLDIDLARAALGGSIVRYSGYSRENWAARLFDGTDSEWVSFDDGFPQDFTLAFRGDHVVAVDRVELTLSAERRPEEWPTEVAVAISRDHPLDGFVEVTRTRLETRPGLHSIPVNRSARFVKVRILDNGGGKITAVSGLAVLEGSTGAASVLAREPSPTTKSDAERSRPADQKEAEPNDTADTANIMAFGQTVSGSIDPLGESDFFALPDFSADATALTIDYAGEPNIRHRLELLDGDGTPLSSFDPGDLPADEALLTFRITGDERLLKLSEPPASVVVIWDTSGSMKGKEGDLEKAVRRYLSRAPANQQIRLVRFSNEVEVLGTGFTSDESELDKALEGKFRSGGGTRLYDAAMTGLDLLAERSGNRAIILMTDGNDTSRTWLGELWAKLERNRIRFYTIGMGDGLQEYSEVMASTGRRMLAHLALSTNGRSFFAAKSSALDDFYRQIAEELATPATYYLKATEETGRGSLELVTVGEELPGATLPAVHVIFDVSGSMAERLPDGTARITAAKAAMGEALRGLPEGAPFGLTVYGARIPERPDKARACTDIVTVQEQGPLKKADVARFIDDLTPRGGTTPLAASVAHVFKAFGKQGGIIIAITDGIEECDPAPLVTVQELAERNVDLKLNLIGFDLRQEETRDMMRELAEVGRGRYFDANDGGAVASALRETMAAEFVVRDATGSEVASGKIGGPPINLSPGNFEVAILAADGALRRRAVRIVESMRTTIAVNKAGSEVSIDVGEPREIKPLEECGDAAARRPDSERVRRIQSGLNAAGFDAGVADNIMGNGTRKAIHQFLAKHSIDVDAEPTLLVEKHLDCIASHGRPYAGSN